MSSLITRGLDKAHSAVRILSTPRLKCRKLAFSLVTGRKGLEIGGPSSTFRRPWFLPIYKKVESLDDCDFQQKTTWASHEQEYCFDKRKPRGRMYFSEGSELKGVSDRQYDFLLSSHNLEHLANPIKALKEWQRVVKPDGYFVIVLPYHAWTFDHRRRPTALQHMVEDYERNVGEDDLTHVDETFEICREPNFSEADDEKLRRLLMNNFSHRMMHHHVFDEFNSQQLLEAAGLKVLAAEPYPPIHLFLIAQAAGDKRGAA